MIATFDIGTTAVKGVLVEDDGRILESASAEIRTIYDGNHKEQDPDSWYEAFCSLSRQFFAIYPREDIEGIIMSGQMQDVILTDADFQAVRTAILYSDGRAEEEAEEISRALGSEYLLKVTGNHYDGSLPLPKLLWVRRHEPENWERTAHVLISSKDYVIGRLTDVAAGDLTACAIAGGMDLTHMKWDEKILTAAGVDPARMPKLCRPHQVVGGVTERGARESGYLPGTRVYAGVGDAGATTLASGIAKPGEYNINLGTSGWVAAVSDHIVQTEGGVVNLAAMPEQCYINVVPFLNAGNVHRWISRVFTPGERREIDYALIEQILGESAPGSHGVMFLPYLVGERFPVMDAQARGTYVGITPETGRADLIRACLEGVAFSIRQGIRGLGREAEKISIIGGGARSQAWSQIFADVLQKPVWVYRNADVLPALAIASSVLLDQGKITAYSEFTDQLQDTGYCSIYQPDADSAAIYDAQYEKYLRLYPAVKEYYGA
ncbi:MAG: sugar kinase [Clostridiales bacterium]|nr:sugar kinase [Clostridiales bacterium]